MDWKTLSKLLRLRRPSTVSAVSTSDESSDDPTTTIHKLNLNLNPKALHSLFSQPLERSNLAVSDVGALESLIADLFASISAIKASYAQIQLAQSPYDPDSIQIADQSVVSHLKKISQLKLSFLNNQIPPPSTNPFSAQIQEHNHLIKTFQITVKKLESDLRSRDSDRHALRSKLAELEAKNGALESKLHRHKSLASLENLHLSALNPNHFVIAHRFAVKSIRSFTKLMVAEMESAAWDINAAAATASLHQIPIIKLPRHRDFAFHSYICSRMFSGFQHKAFNLERQQARTRWSGRRFFDEFSKLKLLSFKEMLVRSIDFGKFCRNKYLSLVHSKMEAAFFGDLDRRSLIRSGDRFPDSSFFNGFGEMAKWVWLLHCLFFSFAPEINGSIFQARRGSRFSEVFMESVAEESEDEVENPISEVPTVGFTVVPGFRVGSTVIQCKVYLSRIYDEKKMYT